MDSGKQRMRSVNKIPRQDSNQLPHKHKSNALLGRVRICGYFG